MRLALATVAVLALLVVAYLVGGLDTLGPGASDDPAASDDELARRADASGHTPPSLVGHPGTSPGGPVAGGTIRGRVLQAGHGVAVPVHLYPVAPPSAEGAFFRTIPDWLYGSEVGAAAPVARAMSQGDGAFAFANVAPGRYEVRAHAPSGARASAALDLAGEGSSARVVLELPTGAPLLEGRARYADGKPFRGFLRVHYGDQMMVCMDPFRTRVDWGRGLFPTGVDGAFVIQGVPLGEVRLAALVPGAARYVSPPVTLPHDGSYEFVVDDGCVLVTGEVRSRPGDRPLPGVRVEAAGERTLGESVRRVIHTDEQGRFAVRIPPRTNSFQVRAADHVPLMAGQSRSDVCNVTWSDFTSIGYQGGGAASFALPPDRHVVLRVDAAARVSGIVRAASDGQPVAGVGVHAAAASSRATGQVATTITDPDGRYELSDVPPGDVVVFVAGSGWISKGLAWVGDEGHGATSRIDARPGSESVLDLEAVSAVGIRGRVVAADGGSVAGAMVRCLPSHVEPIARDFPFDRWSSPAWSAEATTDAEGRFACDTLIPGFPYQVHVVHEEHPRYASPAHRAHERRWTEVEIELPATRGVDVRVLDAATGEGILGVHVSLGNGYDTRAWTTDHDGRAYVEPIGRDTVYVWAKAAGYAGLQRAARSSPAGDEDRTEIVLRLAPSAWVNGRVITPEGISPKRVHVSPALGGSWLARTNEDGGFRCGPVPPGPLELRVYFRLHGKSITELMGVNAPSDDVVIDVRDAWASADGRISEPPAWDLEIVGPDQKPVDEAWCRVWGSVGRDRAKRRVNGFTRPVRAGRATLTLHEEGTPDEVWISVWGARSTGLAGDPPGAIAKQAVRPEGGAVRVVLPAGRRIDGRIVWEDGRPADGARILALIADPTARDDETWLKAQLHAQWDEWGGPASTTCDAEGCFQLRGLGDGHYAVVPVLPPDALAVEVPVLLAGTRDVRLTLRRGVAPVLTVLAPDAMPVAHCNVRIMPSGESEGDPVFEAETNGAGRVRLANLQGDAKYDLLLGPPSGRVQLLPASLEGWTPGPQTVVLRPAFTLTGTVNAAVDPTAPRIRVYWRVDSPAGEARGWQLTWVHGTPPVFAIPSLAEDDVVLLLALSGRRPDGLHDARALRVAVRENDVLLPLQWSD